MKAKLLFATLAELPKKLVKYDKGVEIIFNGENNDYPERVERLTQNSITASQGCKLLRQFITGYGFEGFNELPVNRKGETLFQLLSDSSDDYAKQKGFGVHVMHNVAGEPVGYDVIPFEHIRKGKKDSKAFNGRFAVHSDWQNAKKTEIKWLYSFNPDPKIVQENIKHSGGIDKYPGQLFYFNPSKFDYPLAHLHPVMNDADSQFRASVFKNKSLRKGFFGKNILVTPPKVDPNLTNVPKSQLDDESLVQLRHQEDARDEINDAMKGFVGVENHEGFMSLEMEFEGDDIDKAIKHIKIESDIDDKLFEYTEQSTSNNIRKAYNNIPTILIDSSDHSIFGNSGEAIKEAKKFYQLQVEEEQKLIETAFKRLFKNYAPLKDKTFNIKPLVNLGEQRKEEEDGVN